MGRVGYVPSLLCAEFVMGRVCHVLSLLCAELSLNQMMQPPTSKHQVYLGGGDAPPIFYFFLNLKFYQTTDKIYFVYHFVNSCKQNVSSLLRIYQSSHFVPYNIK